MQRNIGLSNLGSVWVVAKFDFWFPNGISK